MRDRRVPWITVSFTAIGLALLVTPRAAEWLQYERLAVASGAWWRMLTGQLVHWTPRMAFFDLLTLLVTGAWLEQHSRRLLGGLIAGAGLLVGLTVHLWLPDLTVYRGSSGIASALFCATALMLVVEERSTLVRLLALATLSAFAAKIGWEWVTSNALFAGALPEGVRVTPGVHLAGAVTGLLSASISIRTHTERTGR